jgi:hypothetical protein
VAERQTLIVEGGCSFLWEAEYQDEVPPGSKNWQPRNLTGYSARMMVKLGYDDAAPLVSLTSNAGGGLTITAASGVVAVEMTPVQTAAIETAVVAAYNAGTIDQLRAIADLELVSGARVMRMFEADVLVSREVTR